MNNWLFGINSKQLKENIFEITIHGYGPADVGPYSELRKFIKVNSGLECHHIVEVEHLRILNTIFTEHNAPSIAIPESLHRKLISPRFTAEMNVFGGRKGGIATGITKQEILELYKQIYTWHTAFRELFLIAKNILK
jgi:hypothetical protein